MPTKFEFGHWLERWPDADPGAVASAVLASLSRLGIPAIDGRSAIEKADFWERDGHWRPVGHKKVGELLAGFLATRMVAERQSPGQ